MTVRYLVNILLFRLVFPIIVTICVLFRPSVFSFIYLVYLFILPFIPVPTADTMLGSTGRFLKAILGITCSLSLIQAAFQIALVTLNPYAEFLLNDPVLEEILQYIGLVRLNKMSISYILVWIGPEIIMFVATIAFFIVFKRLNPPPGFIVRSEAGTIVVNTVEDTDGSQTEVKQPVSSDYSQYCVAIGRYLTLIMLCLAGVVRPSIESGVYYVIFLAAATWWACYKQLKRGFAILLRCLIPIVILHMCALYFINFKIVQNELPEEGTYSRYFDLLPFATTVDSSSLQEGTNNTSIVNSTSSSLADVNKAGEFSDKRVLLYYFHRELTFYIYPVVLYLLFFFLVVESKELLKPELKKKPTSRFSDIEVKLSRTMSKRLSKQKLLTPTAAQKWQKASRKVRIVINRRKAEVTEKTPLLRGVSPKRRATKSSLHQDSTGSVTVNENEDIPLDVFGNKEDDDDFEYTVFHNVIFALEAIIQKVVRSSYIATNIIMMAWSITYLSWLTFVLLLWANIIWLIPNQRKRMLSSSPFLVFYALFLLISAYIYSMNLNEDELPMTAQGVDLEEIGFKKPDGDPCLPLLVKSLYTVMFWITLRQYMQEKMEKKQTSALADMVAPLQVTVGTATGVKKDDQPAGGEFMKRMGQFINKFLIKFWIWVVAITLFAVAITGQRMTVFRILYMALFLFFILSFQFSFKVWRKVMFGFWLTVIIYSMIILILVYTYQFKRFPKYWEEYLHIQEENQHDIGLEQYKTKQLFVRLVTPTFFVIVTVLQLHYFHNDFMELTNTKPNSIVEDEIIENDDIDDSSMQGGAFMDQSDASAPSKYYSEISYQDLNIVPSDMIKKWVKRTLTVFLYSKHVAYLFFEIHMIKIVLFFAMLMCIYDKCALYFILVIIISFSFAFGRNLQIFATYFTALFVSVLILGRMIYQISYINDKQWNVKCTINQNPTINETVVNNGPWLGFTKLQDADTNLAEIVKWNIIFIVIMTLWKVVDVRQYNYRLSRGRSTSRRFFMFPKITREDADKNLGNFFKYMANYGFYKFGLEICFIFMVTMIGVRMDMYSLIHSIWLVVMFGLSRKTLSRIWLIYLVFVAISIPVQYLLSVGLPPSLCIEFPWDKPNQTMRNLQEWAFLLDNYNPPAARKLIFDFMLLMATARQWVVFRIEKRYEGKNYAGGSNESVIHHAEQKDFVNPVPDFVTYVRSYLDFLKKAVLQSFLWITLAVVFLAGTSRVNIFSIGYLLFAFLFLWHGSDFYLRPINKILWHWNRLLGFNVSVIMLKCAFQILGCIFPHELPIHSCWLVQIFGIACIRNIGPTDNTVASLKHIIEEDGSCSISKEGLTWDVICFTLLIFQKRLFNSYNFFHIVDDAKATAILASRGAELMEEMRLKTMKEQEEIERRVLEKIREKMERIKANQQKIQGDDNRFITNHQQASAPLAKSSSATSCSSTMSQQSGYHTPIDEEEPAPLTLTPRSSLANPQAPPSPYSAVMTVSLEGYLDPHRISFSSPPNSEMNPRVSSPDDSFPVFSPPPYTEAPTVITDVPRREEPEEEDRTEQRRSLQIGPPWLQGSFVTPRQSIISFSSRSPLSHHEYSVSDRPHYRSKQPTTHPQAIRSGDYYMFDEVEDDDIDLLPEEKESLEDLDEGPKAFFADFLHSAIREDVHSALRTRSQMMFASQTHAGLQRQSSVPAGRQTRQRPQLTATISAPPTIAEREPKIVRIQDDTEPEPSTSQQRFDEEDFSSLTEPEKTKLSTKIFTMLLFVWAFLDAAMISLTRFLNKYSKNYRLILKVLAKEKRILKEHTNYNIGLRVGTDQTWQPAGSYHTLVRRSNEGSLMLSQSTPALFSPGDSFQMPSLRRPSSIHSDSDDDKPPLSEDSDTKAMAPSLPCSPEPDRRKASVLTVPEIRILAASLERGLDSPCSPYLSRKTTEDKDKDDEPNYYMEYGDEMSSADQPTVFRLVLAIWYLIMSRSDIVCYFIIFLNQMRNANLISLPLPLMVFFWGTLTIPRPSKTFWVTIIAYTEVVVLLKCLFQFDIMPGNKVREQTEFITSISEQNPFYPPALIGLYKQKNVQAMWDLLLLLVVFFHRVLLKSMGIWSSTSPTTAALIEDGEYRVVDERFEPVEEISEPDENQASSSTDKGKGKAIVKRNTNTSGSGDEIVYIKTKRLRKINNAVIAVRLGLVKYAEQLRLFIQQLLDPTSRVTADVYSLMFLCDFINFFVILFGYSAFGSQQDGGVSSYLEDDRVPPLFLFMLILQFMIILVDRGIYLRKNILAKIIFQFIQIVLLHVWLFILFPIITRSFCNSVIPPQIYYIAKCSYLLLSAFQIRCGYPTRILGNFLCKSYGYVNMFLFRGFMLVPFLFELRTCMDWMWTETSMTIFDWIKMEDIFQNIFLLKCARSVEDEFPQPRAEKKKSSIKYLMGGAILTLIIGIIWFPLVFYSLGNAVGNPNPPLDVTLEIRVGPYEPLYKMTAQSNSIFQFNADEMEDFKSIYNAYQVSENFIFNYEAADVTAIKLSTDSANIWSISPPDRIRMISEINSTKDLKVRLEYKITHKTSKAEDSGIIIKAVEIILPPSTNTTANVDRENLLKMLNGENSNAVLFPYIMPKFIKVTNRGTAEPVDVLMLEKPDTLAKMYRNMTIKLLRVANPGGFEQEWWKVKEQCDDYNYDHFLNKIAYKDCEFSLILYAFSDKVFPPTLSFVTAGGIIGLYTTLVFVASRILRGFFADGFSKIMFEDLPNVDRVLRLCLDIYLVREACDFFLEEDLFAKLVFLYRSPETLIKWTRPKEEVADDDDPEGEEARV